MISYQKNLVSVIIPTYNRAKRLLATIESCLEQTHPDIEILIIDDGSTDKTQEILKYCQEKWGKKIRIFSQAHQGACVARNRGLDEAKGEYIQFLDSDDFLDCEKFEIQVKALRSGDYSAAVCDTYVIDENQDNKVIFEKHNDVDLQLKISNFQGIGMSAPLMRRDSIPSYLRFNPNLARSQDLDFHFLYFLSIKKWIYTSDVKCWYVEHSDEKIYQFGKKYIHPHLELVKSVYFFWKKNHTSLPTQNQWMMKHYTLWHMQYLRKEGELLDASKIALTVMRLRFDKKSFKKASKVLKEYVRSMIKGYLSQIEKHILIKRVFPFF